MSKNLKFKIITIMIFAIFLLLVPMQNIVQASTFEDYGKYSNWREYIFNNVNKATKVGDDMVMQDYGKDNKDGDYISTLSLLNTYCVGHGIKLHQTTYKSISKSAFTVTDPILEYIFANGPAGYGVTTGGKLESEYWTEPSQIVLWHYLLSNASKNSYDANIMTNGNPGGYGHSSTSYECCDILFNSDHKTLKELTGEYKKFWDAAQNYKQMVSHINGQPELSAKLDGNTLKVTVGGDFTDFELKINDQSKGKYEKTMDETKEITFNNVSSASSIKVTVTAERYEYNVKYYVYVDSANRYQPVVVITDVTKRIVTTSATTTINNKVNVSLQKYIHAVNDSTSNIPVYPRTHLMATGSSANRIYANGKFRTEQGYSYSTSYDLGYKKDKPVTIKKGDVVTYYIFVYNNGNGDMNVGIIDSMTLLNKNGTSSAFTSWTVQENPLYEWANAPGYTAGGKFNCIYSSRASYSKNGNKLSLGNVALSSGEMARITLKLKINADISSDQLIENNAKINNYTNPNGYRTDDSDYIKMNQTEAPKTNVSLQKYIAEVNGQSLTADNTDTTRRWNLRAQSNSISEIFNTRLKYTSPDGDYVGTSYDERGYKIQHPVIIKNGDVVTYYIFVYVNDNNYIANDIIVKDQLTHKNSGSSPSYIIQEQPIIEYSYDGNSSFDDASPLGVNISNNMITFSPFNLDNKAARITLKVKINEQIPVGDMIENKAYIYDTDPENNTTFRTEDADYVKMIEQDTPKTDVSLQKYIAQVNNQNLTTSNTSVQNRWNLKDEQGSIDQIFDGNIFNNPAGLQYSTSYRDLKSKNPVKIIKGDTVTYYIYVYNNSENKTNLSVTDALGFVSLQNNLSDNDYTIINSIIEFGSDGFNFSNGKELTYDKNGNTIEFDTFDLEGKTAARITLNVRFNTDISDKGILRNYACISYTSPENNTTYRTEDADYVEMIREYKVSLEKYISSVHNDKGVDVTINSRRGLEEYKTERNGVLVDETDKDSKWTQHNKRKELSPVTVGNGYYITYTIIVRNDGICPITVSKIIDSLPEGISHYKDGGYSATLSDYTVRTSDGKITIIRTAATLLQPGDSTSVTLTVIVSESNLSMRVLKNTAKITELKDGNDILNADDYDMTPYNNQDSDYFQMNLMIPVKIGGMVWNDKALNKQQDNYNGIYDAGSENKLGGIKVYLYREGESSPVDTTVTRSDGSYEFTNIPGRNRVTGDFYSYYIVFEYDGITYTPTVYEEVATPNDDPLTSNAREKLNSNDNFDGIVDRARTTFNSAFGTINNSKGISYTTKNEAGWTPESHHSYNSSMAIQASTRKITIRDNDSDLMAKLQHINLGLRGRDIVDLQLTSDVYSTRVTVNGVDGAYKFNSNQVTVRQEDIGIASDAANFGREELKSSISKVDQDIRNTDIKNSQYDHKGLKIQVTYKLTIKNASVTTAKANIITDYFDNKYDFVEAYYLNGNNKSTLNTSTRTSGNGYKSVAITTPNSWLGQSASIDIYLVLDLKDAETVLQQIVNSGVGNLPTFNIAEITEYSTTVTSGGTEFTRGLIDKDSAPGSIDREQARLTTTLGQSTPTVGGNPTTLGYYYGKAIEYLNDRSKTEINNLKCEDDTTTSPVLYFTASGNNRTISGTVFRDNTKTDATTRIKTGNGKLDNGEVGVYGATVELIELVGNDQKVRSTVTTGRDGKYTFSGFLPGNYMIRYHYGDTTDTVLLNQAGPDINKYSYNGEDYQATNNTGTYGASKLDTTPDFWYVYNENQGVSTATDSISRRNTVSANVTDFTDEQMTVLNNIRDGKNAEDAKVTYTKDDGTTETITVQDIIDKTNMESNTPKFHITVEKTEITSGGLQEKAAFSPYDVTNMNFGVAEVPVTTINLTKEIKEFSIIDSAGENVMAKASKNASGVWEFEGEVIKVPEKGYDVSIIDERLQGARLTVTYTITSTISLERNFNNGNAVVPTITGMVDFIDNDLSYNPNLGNNNTYWESVTFNDVRNIFAQAKYKNGSVPKGTVDPDGTKFQTIVKAKSSNPILTPTNGTATTEITLEKVLSSTDSTFEEIVTSTVDGYEYNNIIEITGLDYKNVTDDGTEPQRDRVRIPTRYIILPGVQHDSAEADIITVHPPTGDSSMMITYYVIGAVSLVILAGGIFIIKKYVIAK